MYPNRKIREKAKECPTKTPEDILNDLKIAATETFEPKPDTPYKLFIQDDTWEKMQKRE